VGFPAVIKPIAAAASMGVVRVDNLQELKHKFEATQKQMDNLYLDEHVSGRNVAVASDRLAMSRLLGVLDWFWIYRLAGHAHCTGWRPLRTAQPCFQPCFHVKPSYNPIAGACSLATRHML